MSFQRAKVAHRLSADSYKRMVTPGANLRMEVDLLIQKLEQATNLPAQMIELTVYSDIEGPDTYDHPDITKVPFVRPT